MKRMFFSALLLLMVICGFSNPFKTDSASFYLNKAHELINAHKNTEAEKCFQKAIQFDPLNENIRLEYGNFLVDQHKLFPAIEQYGKILEQNNTHQVALQKLTYANFLLNRWNDVIMYAKKLDQNSSTNRLNYMIGKAYYQTENYGQARKYLEAQINSDTVNADALSLLGKTYIELNDYNNAIAAYTKAINLDPDNSQGIYELGLLYQTLKKNREAVKYYELAVQKGYRQSLDVLENMGLAYLAFDIPKGIETLNKVLEMKPGNSEILFQIAQAFFKIKKYQEAADHYRKMYDADPSNARALYMSGVSYIMKGDANKGKAICDEAIRLDPSLARLKYAKLEL